MWMCTAAQINAAMAVLGALSFCHLLNDMMQSLLPAMYPILKTGLRLDFGQIGLVTFVYQVTASLFQPLVGLYTDRRPMPYALAFGMGFTLDGLAAAVVASSFPGAVARRCRHRARLVGLSSRVVARRARSRPAVVMGSRNRCSRSAATQDRRSVRSRPRSSCCRTGRAASPGSRSPRCSASCCSPRIGALVRAPDSAAQAVRKSAHHALVQLPRGKVDRRDRRC